MRTLAEVQAGIRDALVHGDSSAVMSLLVGGVHPEHRLAIHQRHYAASLTRALVERFPATAWLVGSDLVTHAAQTFVRDHPPETPCIAEYGEAFPRYLRTQAGTDALPYLAQFAEIDWHLGRLALATNDSPHVHVMHLDWSLDELMAIFLTDNAPEQFALRCEDVSLEIRGLRGELSMTRLSEAAAARASDQTQRNVSCVPS
jgi:hypothetical protein